MGSNSSTENLKVMRAQMDDVFGDIVRVHISHRPVYAGDILKVSVNGNTILAIARNTQNNERDVIRLDDALRRRLRVDPDETHAFRLSAANSWDQFMWAWRATNPVNRIAARLAGLSLALGVAGILLGLLSLYLTLT